jgi:hypothetical protein
MVLKRSEIAPLNAIIFAEVMHAAGVPKGVFDLVSAMCPRRDAEKADMAILPSYRRSPHPRCVRCVPESYIGFLSRWAMSRHRLRRRRVTQVVLGDELVHRREIVSVDLLVEAPRQGFVFGKHRVLLYCGFS